MSRNRSDQAPEDTRKGSTPPHVPERDTFDPYPTILEKLIEVFPGIVFWKDKNSVYRGCNSYFSTLAGLPGPAAIAGMTDYDMPCRTEDAERYRAEDRQVVESGKPMLKNIERFQYTDGRTGWFSIDKVPIMDRNGEVIGVLGVGNEITERKRAEEALQFEHSQLLSIFDSIDEVIYVSDPHTYEIIYTNKWTRKLYQKELIEGKCFREFQSKDSPCEFCTNKIILRNKGKPYKWEYHNPVLDIDFLIVDRIIRWPDGRDVRFEMAIDITAQKRAEAALIERGRRLETIGMTMPGAIYQFELTADRKYRFPFVSERWPDLFGVTPDEAMASPDSTFSAILPEDLGDVHSTIAQSAATLDIWKCEFRTVVNGRVKWILGRSVPDKPRHDGSIVWNGVLMDTTELKTIEEALKESEERFRAIFEQAAVGIAQALPDGRIIRVNDQFCEIAGYARDELIGKLYEDITEQEDRPVERKHIDELLSGKISTFTIEKRYVRKDETKVWVTLTVSLVKEADGKPKYLLGVVKDITDRKRAEAIVDSSLSHLKATLESTADAIMVASDDGFIIRYNQKFSELWNIPAEILATGDENAALKVGSAQVKEPAKFISLIKNIYAGRAWNTFNTIDFSDGKNIELYSQLLMIGGKPSGRVWSCRDVTERKRAEAALKVEKAQSELYLDLMSHDLTNMNQAIMGYLELLKATQEHGAVDRELIDKPIEIVNRSSRLIDTVKKLTLIQAGMVPRETVDLYNILKDIIPPHEKNETRTVTVNYSCRPGCRVLASDLLKDVLDNILDNAVRHSTGPVTIDIAVDRICAPGRDWYEITVADNGPGIHDELKKKIFAPPDAEKKPERRGLGLYFVRTLIDYYRGTVAIEDRVPGDPKKGSKVIVRLPAA